MLITFVKRDIWCPNHEHTVTGEVRGYSCDHSRKSLKYCSSPKVIFLSKVLFLTKISIIDQNFYFWSKFLFSTKIRFLPRFFPRQNFDLYPTLILIRNFLFGQKFHFWTKLLFLGKISGHNFKNRIFIFSPLNSYFKLVRKADTVQCMTIRPRRRDCSLTYQVQIIALYKKNDGSLPDKERLLIDVATNEAWTKKCRNDEDYDLEVLDIKPDPKYDTVQVVFQQYVDRHDASLGYDMWFDDFQQDQSCKILYGKTLRVLRNAINWCNLDK